MNILKFRSKGGKFYSKADFRKIYGVTNMIYDQIAPFLLLENENKKLTERSSMPGLFLFNPNKATDQDFLRLGLSDKQISTIRKYMKQGGSFRNKDDFFKIRVISENQKRILSDYLVIDGLEKPVPEKAISFPAVLIELNSADSTRLRQLPGIGVVLSKRIVKYRDLLGGFYSMSQLKEVYGLNEQTLTQIESKLTIDVSKIRKLDFNFAEVNELARHPYLQKKLAGQVVKFRSKNGSIRDLSILRDSMILNIDDYNRLKPYF
jgi:DNA uptake protein ComE-like DNA-binding protein